MFSTATVNYHVKSSYPQAFHFDVNGELGALDSPVLEPVQILVQDIRDGKMTVNYDTDGITFDKHHSQIQNFPSSDQWREVYDKELGTLIAETTGAKEVIIFDHTIRIDSEIATRRPARNVHNDYSPAGAKQRLIDLVGEHRASEISEGHFAFVNLWRPIENPIKTAPLGFIHPDTVKVDDWMHIELIYPDRQGQILGVAAHKDHRWFYMSHMTPDEVVIFNVYDNRGKTYLAHGAMDVKNDNKAATPRKSIETRTLVIF